MCISLLCCERVLFVCIFWERLYLYPVEWMVLSWVCRRKGHGRQLYPWYQGDGGLWGVKVES